MIKVKIVVSYCVKVYGLTQPGGKDAGWLLVERPLHAPPPRPGHPADIRGQETTNEEASLKRSANQGEAFIRGSAGGRKLAGSGVVLSMSLAAGGGG